MQLWIALPDAERERAPMFQHCAQLPHVGRDGFDITPAGRRLARRELAGDGVQPVAGRGPARRRCSRDDAAAARGVRGSRCSACLDGEARIEGEALAPGTLCFLGTGRETLRIETDAAARLLLLGGEPFAEDVLLWWNFVARSAGEMAQATRDWNHGDRFGEVRGTGLPRLVAPAVEGLHLRISKSPSDDGASP